MNSGFLFPYPPLVIFFITILVFVQIPVFLCYDLYSSCSKKYHCGDITDVGYPFWGNGRVRDCGKPDLFLNCKGNITFIEMRNVTYRVLSVNMAARSLKIARNDSWGSGGICSLKLVNTTLDSNLFVYSYGYKNITLVYGCNSTDTPGLFSCPGKGRGYIAPGAIGPGICKESIYVPVLQNHTFFVDIGNWFKIEEVMKEGFEVNLKEDKSCSDCIQSNKGVCVNNAYTNQTTCFYAPAPNKPQGLITKLKRQFLIGVSSGLAGIMVLVFIVIVYCLRRKSSSCMAMIENRNVTKNKKSTLHFSMNQGSLSPKQYSYSEIKKMTNSFKDKIGQGGYGSVYKGQLLEGHLVAVKIISELKSSGEEFINEVASISRTSHVNIVTLLGYCNEATKRALVYEFMPNGSLDKFIYNQGFSKTSCQLERKSLFQIAIGIARGLEYLHRGCSTRILHFDIKPQNILLDEDFCPKISDFGLARLCQRNNSIVSLLGARGTIGYIAPEVFCRNFGRVSYKSDVYSYGMLLLEMVAGRKNFDIELSHTSERFFPDWIYEHLNLGENIGNNMAVTDEGEEMEHKMILVSLWCIQTISTDRPSMSKVVEMLEGSLQSIDIPPKPFLSSPTRSPQNSSTISSS